MASVLLKNGLWRPREFPRIPSLSSSRRILFTGGRLGNLGFVCAYGNSGDEKWDPSLDIAVPEDQRPANELAALKERALYSWAELKPNEFFIRLGGLWAFFFVFPGAPIAAASFDPSREPLKFFLAGESGALFAVAILILRMYLGWSYVGDRLLSAVVAYEETGWYDGQLWVKPPEVLARDRLLGSFQVKPIMNRLKQTLIGSGVLLTASTAALILLSSDTNNKNVVFLPNTSQKITLSKEELLNPPAEVEIDDDLAAAAAQAADGRPVYCTDRYFRALAGGQYCKWEDLRK